MKRVRLLSLVFVALLGSSCSTFAVAAATVNGEKITEAEVESELNRVRSDPTFQDLLQRQADQLRGVARRNILSSLIRQSVLDQEARRRNIRVTRASVDRLIEQEAGRQGLSVEDFREANNLSVADARTIGERIVRLFELRGRVITEVAVDDDDVRAAFDAQKEAFVEVNLLRITVRTEQEAARVLEEVEDGSTFAELAPERSIDELADEGGDMGFVPSTSLSGQAQEAIQATGIGDVTDPIPGPGGFEIYRVVDRRQSDFGDVEDQLRSQLSDQTRERQFEEWLGRRLRAAAIVVNPKYGRYDDQGLQVVPGSQELRP
jgi:peptidyl-prolyl cis-trans isomerase SurA